MFIPAGNEIVICSIAGPGKIEAFSVFEILLILAISDNDRLYTKLESVPIKT